MSPTKSLLVALGLMIAATIAFSQTPETSNTVNTIYDIPLKDIDGKPASLADYKGKVILIVNVASKCGFTKQYTALEELYQKYKDKGFFVLGFPCNDFKNQEPGTNEEIKTFCSTKYNVTFPLFDKLHTKGDEMHPLYKLLTTQAPTTGDVGWNFEKFLIGKDGKIVGRYKSKITPNDPTLVAALEGELGK